MHMQHLQLETSRLAKGDIKCSFCSLQSNYKDCRHRCWNAKASILSHKQPESVQYESHKIILLLFG